jgi:hypothetical protein
MDRRIELDGNDFTGDSSHESCRSYACMRYTTTVCAMFNADASHGFFSLSLESYFGGHELLLYHQSMIHQSVLPIFLIRQFLRLTFCFMACEYPFSHKQITLLTSYMMK